MNKTVDAKLLPLKTVAMTLVTPVRKCRHAILVLNKYLLKYFLFS